MPDAVEEPVTDPAQTQSLRLSTPLPPDRDPAVVYLASLSEGSRRTIRCALNKVARLLGLDPVKTEEREITCRYCRWAGLRLEHMTSVRSQLVREYAPATVNKHLSAIRGTLKAAYRLGQMTGEEYHRAAGVESVSAEREPAGRLLTQSEIDALMRACTDDPTPAGARDAAMIALWAVTGPRRAEIVNLNAQDYDRETGAVRIRGHRNQTERTVYIANNAKEAVDDWLDVRGQVEGPLFVPIHQSGKLRISRMTPQAAYSILRKRAQQAGIDAVSPHDLRRTAVSNLIDKTDLSTAQRIAGHADPKTTARYDRRGDRVKQEAAEAMTLSYHRER